MRMKLATPRLNQRTESSTIDVFKGLNNALTARENEFSSMKNMSSDYYPMASSRKSRELVRTLTAPNGLFSDGLKLCWVDGTKFYYDGVEKGTVTNGKKCFVEINKNVLIFPDRVYYDTVAGTFGSFASGNPEIDYAVVHNNRVFGVKGQNIYASKQGDFKQWNAFSGLVTDSWATDVAGYGSFKGITRYQNHVVMQTETTMFELYGYKPENFQVQETVKHGLSIGSYAELNSTLYFANENGAFMYTGGLPRSITEDRLTANFASCKAGTDGKKYYLSLADGLYVYDSEYDLWHKEEMTQAVDFAYLNNILYALLTDGKMIKFGSGNEKVQFEAIFSESFDGDYFNKKNVRRIELYAEMGADSYMGVSVRDSSKNDFITVGTFASETHKNLVLPVIVNAAAYEIKLSGYGDVKIKAMKKVIARGGKR